MQKAQPFRLNISCSHLLLTICCSQQTLASTISSWWAQLAALEAEWLLEKHVEAREACGKQAFTGLVGTNWKPSPLTFVAG